MFVSAATIECENITDWDSFHAEFNRVFGFPDFYGRNMNAWIDCMTDLDDADGGMTSIHVKRGEALSLELSNAGSLKAANRELFDAIVESVAFVNWRRAEQGEPHVLSLSFHISAH